MMNQIVDVGIKSLIGSPIGTPYGVPTQNLVTRTTQPPVIPPPAMPSTGLKRALNYLADYGGCGFYRCMSANFLLNINQKAVITESTTMILDERFYQTVDAIKVQRQATTYQKDFLFALKQMGERTQRHTKMIYEIDDVVFAEDIPIYNRNRDAFTSTEIQSSIKDILGIMDEIVVTTDYFKEYMSSKIDNKKITVIPNYLMKWWFDRYYNLNQLLKAYDKNKKKPIVAIFASGTHCDVLNRTNQQDDFAFVVDNIIKTRTEFNWHFYGSYPLTLKPFIDKGEMKFFPWVQLSEFPETMAKSGAQLTFACLQDNNFNRCKSNIKLIEAGALGLPCVCPDMVTYKDAFLKYKNGNEFIDCIKTTLKNQTTYADMCKKSRAFAEKFWLDDEHNLMKHHEVYFTPYKSSERKFIV
jgi:hypothetical protein